MGNETLKPREHFIVPQQPLHAYHHWKSGLDRLAAFLLLIPGVPLIGPKIARELIEKYDSLDNLLAHAEELPKGKRKDNLIAGREQAIPQHEFAYPATELLQRMGNIAR